VPDAVGAVVGDGEVVDGEVVDGEVVELEGPFVVLEVPPGWLPLGDPPELDVPD